MWIPLAQLVTDVVDMEGEPGALSMDALPLQEAVISGMRTDSGRQGPGAVVMVEERDVQSKSVLILQFVVLPIMINLGRPVCDASAMEQTR